MNNSKIDGNSENKSDGNNKNKTESKIEMSRNNTIYYRIRLAFSSLKSQFTR